MRARHQTSSALWAFVDLLFNAFFIVVCLYVLQALLPHAKAAEEAKKAGITAGKMCIELSWPDAIASDIDLIGRGPDGQIVTYKNKSVPLMDLLRDDLGDDEPGIHHFETICSRTLAAGLWTFNAHYYAAHQAPEPADVPIVLTVSFPISEEHVAAQAPIISKAHLAHPGSEMTMADFEIDAHGRVIPTTINTILQPLRTKGITQ